MNEQIRKALAPLTQFWGNASKTLKRGLIGGVIVAIIAALAVSFLLNSKDYVVIFDQLSDTETSEILAQLQDMGVDVKLDKKGAIMVPKDQETSVRMQLATKGYPKSGLSYYLIQENNGVLTTDYERKQYMNMQLQERIAASIETLDGVQEAVVTITIPNDDVFYLQEKEKPSASVIIHMKPGNTLTSSQIYGIQNLVAKSVQGLSKDNIALTDSEGNDLVANGTGGADDPKLSITRQYEDDIRKKVTAVLLGPYDASQFKVSVTATMDTDQMVTEQTLYSPSQAGNNTGVISEESKSQQSSSSTSGNGGVAGTSSNSQVPTYPSGSSVGQNTSSSTTDDTKYQVSQTKSQSQKNGARVENVSIGIAINKASFDPGERESVTQLVAYAAGVSPASISVQNFQFHEETPVKPAQATSGINKMILYGGIGAGVLVLAGLTALILLRRKKKTLAEEGEMMAAHTNAQDALNAVFGEMEEPSEVIKPITPVQDARKEEIKQFAKANPEIVAQMIKSLLRSED